MNVALRLALLSQCTDFCCDLVSPLPAYLSDLNQTIALNESDQQVLRGLNDTEVAALYECLEALAIAARDATHRLARHIRTKGS